MKKLIILSLLIATTLPTASVFADTTIPVYFNDQPIKLSQKAVITNGSTLVPFRSIFESLGFSVSWDNKTKSITASKDDITITLKPGSTTAIVNGEETTLATPPQIIKGSTMVPLRFVSESAGFEVNWNSKDRYVTIGENDENLINEYEDISTITLSNGQTIRVADLTTEQGTGAYVGYTKISGHTLKDVEIYTKNVNGTNTAFVNFLNLNLDEEVIFTLDGQDYTMSKKSAFEFIDNLITSTNSNNEEVVEEVTTEETTEVTEVTETEEIVTETTEESTTDETVEKTTTEELIIDETTVTSTEINLEEVFGQTYQDYLYYQKISADSNTIVKMYFQNADSAIFEKVYQRYVSDKASDRAFNQVKENQEKKAEKNEAKEEKKTEKANEKSSKKSTTEETTTEITQETPETTEVTNSKDKNKNKK